MRTAKQMETFLYEVFYLLSQENEELVDYVAGTVDDTGEGPDADEQALLAIRDMQWGTFEEKGILTPNRGLVVKLGGAEFQITVLKSR